MSPAQPPAPETLLEAHDGVALALDALATPQLTPATVREATGHLRHALRQITTLTKGAAT
ncbi:MAG: hypothetical protein ACU0DW_14880 [Shimia sp.]